MEKETWVRIGAISGFLAVALGAFGAHALKDFLVEHQTLATWKTAVLYQMVHSVVLLLPVSSQGKRFPAAFFIAMGILLFSGSLYALALGAPGFFGMVTPLGGLFFLAGWLRLFRAAGSA